VKKGVKLTRNILAILLLITIVWISFLFVSYITSITILYTLEFPENPLIGTLRVVIGVLIAGAWVAGWYKLTKLWLYKILLSRKQEV